MSDGDGVVKIDADSVRIVKINAPAATRVELWRFATPDPAAPATRIPMVRGAEGDWTAEAPLAHGDAYALRADGPTIDGHRFHPDRWLLWLGLLFVLCVYHFPTGIVGRLRS